MVKAEDFQLQELFFSADGIYASLFVALIATCIEGFFGYPPWISRRIQHPVVWIGSLIAKLETVLNREELSPWLKRIFGCITTLLVACVVLAVTLPIAIACRLAGPVGWLIEALLASSLLAQRSLHDHVLRVAQGLSLSGARGLQAGRTELAHIVGRDPRVLDRHGVARAAIESLAENYSDGVLAPMFWLAVGGLPGAAVYKAINTLDSMIGYKSPRFIDFGKCAARLDDVSNFIPARLAASLICAAAGASANISGQRACAAVRKDARKLESPNAGWPEAAFGGALNLALIGPMSYNGVISDKPWIGGSNRRAEHHDIRSALQLYRRVCAFGMLGIGLIISLFQLAF